MIIGAIIRSVGGARVVACAPIIGSVIWPTWYCALHYGDNLLNRTTNALCSLRKLRSATS